MVFKKITVIKKPTQYSIKVSANKDDKLSSYIALCSSAHQSNTVNSDPVQGTLIFKAPFNFFPPAATDLFAFLCQC